MIFIIIILFVAIATLQKDTVFGSIQVLMKETGWPMIYDDENRGRVWEPDPQQAAAMEGARGSSSHMWEWRPHLC